MVGDSHSVLPTGRALTVSVYAPKSAVSRAYANSMLETVEVGRVIRLGVLLVGEYVAWYSIAAAPQSTLGVAVNVMLLA